MAVVCVTLLTAPAEARQTEVRRPPREQQPDEPPLLTRKHWTTLRLEIVKPNRRDERPSTLSRTAIFADLRQPLGESVELDVEASWVASSWAEHVIYYIGDPAPYPEISFRRRESSFGNPRIAIRILLGSGLSWFFGARPLKGVPVNWRTHWADATILNVRIDQVEAFQPDVRSLDFGLGLRRPEHAPAIEADARIIWWRGDEGLLRGGEGVQHLLLRAFWRIPLSDGVDLALAGLLRHEYGEGSYGSDYWGDAHEWRVGSRFDLLGIPLRLDLSTVLRGGRWPFTYVLTVGTEFFIW